MRKLLLALFMGWLFATAFGATPARAQDPQIENDESGFFSSWERMVERTEANQPDWLSPIATSSGRLKNEFRFDAWRQISPSGETGYTLGGGKSLDFILAPRLQVMFGLPSYSVMGSREGLGDMPFMLKVRLASAPPREGDFMVTLLLGATLPTGSRAFGLRDAVLSPALALGKGWKRFDVQSTLGASLPTGDTTRLGRQFSSNTAFQYRARWKLWPEVEVNSTSFLTGKYFGQTQTFLTPGLGFGRTRFHGRLHFSAGVGYQIAVTGFHTYNHRWMYSVRFPF